MIIEPCTAADFATVESGHSDVDGSGMSIVDGMMHGPHDGRMVHLPGQPGEMFADLIACQRSRYGMELPTNAGALVRLHVPHIHVRGTAV